jgi:glycerophosphoryl diester phosphodiesterase
MISIAVILAVIVLVAALLLWMLWPASPTPEMRALLKGRKYAHRGMFDNKTEVPENSLAAFGIARDMGYGIELDIHLTSDGEVVVFHDDTIARMCGGLGKVETLSLKELRALSLLSTHQKIPTLRELLSLVDGSVPLLIEFKTGLPRSADVRPLCEAASRLLDGYKGDYLVESFDANVLSWFKSNRPKVMRGQLALGFETYQRALGKEGAASIPLIRRRMLSWLLFNYTSRPHFISYRFEDAGLPLRICRILGAMVAVWTVRKQEDSARLLAKYDAVIFEGFNA